MTDAHLASCAAQKQGKFHEFMAAFWEKGFNAARAEKDMTKLGMDNIVVIATELGIDVEKLKADMEPCKETIKADMAEMSRFRVSGTPSFFINGKSGGYAGPAKLFKDIEAALEDVKASGVPAAEYYDKVVMTGSKKFRSRLDAMEEKNKAKN